jgi:hypothetical protein
LQYKPKSGFYLQKIIPQRLSLSPPSSSSHRHHIVIIRSSAAAAAAAENCGRQQRWLVRAKPTAHRAPANYGDT